MFPQATRRQTFTSWRTLSSSKSVAFELGSVKRSNQTRFFFTQRLSDLAYTSTSRSSKSVLDRSSCLWRAHSTFDIATYNSVLENWAKSGHNNKSADKLLTEILDKAKSEPDSESDPIIKYNSVMDACSKSSNPDADQTKAKLLHGEENEDVSEMLAQMQAMQEKMEKGESIVVTMIDALFEHDDKAFLAGYYELIDFGFSHENIAEYSEFMLVEIHDRGDLLTLLQKHLDDLKK